MPKKVSIGVVTSDKNSKTRRVEIPRLVQHPRYGKYIRKKTICYVHDENDESHLGDLVEIIEGRRRSKTKRWELVRILDKNTAVDLAAMQAQSDIAESEVLESEVEAEETPETESEATAAPESSGDATDDAETSE
ncbi:MAG: 30S ribosomal protein S17 [Planctomycetaceae bacterium]|jgi:small subunit ribosomal protein S17|nr:30S ribosomal protein S17 [Planctomycetaceae bacterium]